MGCSASTTKHEEIEIPPIAAWNGEVVRSAHVPFILPWVEGEETGNESAPLGGLQDLVRSHAASSSTSFGGCRLRVVHLPMHWGDARWKHADACAEGAQAVGIFQADPQHAGCPLESRFLHTRLPSVGGNSFDRLYNLLKQSAEEGFTVSSIVAQPNRDTTDPSAPLSAQVVCQRPRGTHQQRYYTVVNCPIQLAGAEGSSQPSLRATLARYAGMSCRIATIFKPPIYLAQGSKKQLPCHFVFEKSESSYLMAFIDVRLGAGKNPLDHRQYVDIIEKGASSGWELAGMIDLPDSHNMILRIVFQARDDQMPKEVFKPDDPEASESTATPSRISGPDAVSDAVLINL